MEKSTKFDQCHFTSHLLVHLLHALSNHLSMCFWLCQLGCSSRVLDCVHWRFDGKIFYVIAFYPNALHCSFLIEEFSSGNEVET